jgi:serine protease Do
MSFRKGFALGLAMLLVIVAGALSFRKAFVKSTGALQNKLSPADDSSLSPLKHNFEALAASVMGALVNVNTLREDAATLRDPFRDFFSGRRAFDLLDGNNSRRSSLGSGFIVASNGYILTNSHVVENASKISVKLSDHRIMDAVVAGTDPKTDLAVLKIPGSNLPVLHLAQSDDVAVGDWVAAFGSPFGLEQTMTAGIISAKGRGAGPEPYGDLLQTDAAINPGNSGGPLVNLRGEVVGINTMIATRGLGFNGIGFAIPATTAGRVYDQLIKSGKVTRGWIGIRIQEVTPEIARSFGLKVRKGALVSEVASEGPAAKAGLRSGDIILEFNQQQILTSHDLSAAVADAKVGTSARMKVLRNGKELQLDLLVGEHPSAMAQRFRPPQLREPGRLGITVENVTPETQAQMNLLSSRGVLVIEVTPGSAADAGGVQPGDVIHAINHSPVYTAADLLAVTRNLREDSTVLLRLERQGKVLYLAFELS